MELPTFQYLKKNLKKDFSSLKKIKIAILGDSATQMYAQAIRAFGYNLGLDLDIYDADYNQIELQVFDDTSELYTFKPSYIIIFHSSKKLFTKFGMIPVTERFYFAQNEISKYERLYLEISKQLNSKIIFFNINENTDLVFGNFANKTPSSFLFQVRKINFELMNLAYRLKNLFILDLNSLQSQYGSELVSENKIYVNTKLFFKIDFLPIIAKNTLEIIQAIEGKFKKCLILDLDHTLWGGIIGDDGIEKIQIGDLGIGKVYSEIQIWVKLLKQRGIILAICSKNNEVTAQEPFLKHPDMVLSLDDIAVFVANWNNKADNIKYIRKVLNIGFDSMVFLDDNPFERNMVRTHVPDICVPELPEDPAEYLNYIRTLNLFETASFTEEDELRTSKYKVEAKRTISQQQFTNETDFLKSLNMVSIVESFNKFNTPRVAQLTQRSNQFNLRTIRYTEDEIVKISNNEKFINLAFSLKDKYGDYGLISLIILNRTNDNSLFIDTWIMSCRVLKRDMEKFVMNTIVDIAKQNGFDKIYGEYLQSSKNSMVEKHYSDLGFSKNESLWKLNLNEYKNKDCFIQKA